MAARRVLGAAIAGLVCLVGCGSGQDWPDGVHLTSEHFSYHARGDDQLCSDLLERLEANVADVSAVLDLDPARIRVEYYKYRDLEDVRANGPCPGDWHSCASGATIHTGARQAVQHELIHGYVAHLGQPNNVFQEGLAEIFNCEAMAGPADPGVSWQDLARVASQPPAAAPSGIGRGAYYSASAFLVRSLIDRFGVGPFMRFYADGSTNRASVEQFRAELEAAFGEPIDVIWAEAFAPSTVFGWPYLCLCERAGVLETPNAFDETCGAGLSATFAYSLGESAHLALVVNGQGAGGILRSCDGKAPSPALQMATDDYLLPSQSRPGFALLTELPPGTFYVSPYAGAGSFTLERTSWIGAGCDTVQPLRMGEDLPGDYKLWVSIPSTEQRWLRLGMPAPFTQALPGMLEYCSACSPGVGTSCPSPQSTSESFPAGEFAIRVGPGAGPRFHQVGVQYDFAPR